MQDDIDNVCFVCGIDRNTFDRKHPIGFEHHIRNEHNLWHYLSFMVPPPRSPPPPSTPPPTPHSVSSASPPHLRRVSPHQVHLRVKNVTDYTGPETYVRDMLVKNDFSFFPILKTSSIIVEDVSNEVPPRRRPSGDHRLISPGRFAGLSCASPDLA